MKVVPLKPRQAGYTLSDDDPTAEDFARLADYLGVAPFGLPGTGLSPGRAKPMSEAVLANKIKDILDVDALDWPPQYHRPRLKHIVNTLRDAEGEPVDLVGLVSLLEWQDLLAPLEVIRRLLEEGLREDGPLALTSDNLYVLKPGQNHAAQRVP